MTLPTGLAVVVYCGRWRLELGACTPALALVTHGRGTRDAMAPLVDRARFP